MKLASVVGLLVIVSVYVAAIPIQARSGIPMPDHVVIVMEENRAYSAVIGSPEAPYINFLASQGALMTNTYANGHPTQPNYLELFAGSTLGVTTNACPLTFHNVPNLASELIAHGFTYASFSEDLPSIGDPICSNGRYDRVINVSINFDNVPASTSLPFSYFPTDFSRLPTVTFVIPNYLNDMHSDTVDRADTWLQQHITAYAQ